MLNVNVDAASHRFQPTPRSASLSRTHRCVRDSTEGWAPDGKVIDRDLNATAMAPINAEWVGAVYTPEAARTPQQKELLSLSDSLLAEVEQADEYVVRVPMHNFGVPSVLKLWIDQIARVGRTFSYSEKGPKGLITGKKATFIIATGGMYNAQTRMATFNFVEAVSAVRIWFSWRDGRDLPHRRGDRCAEPGAGPDGVSCTAPRICPAIRADARTDYLERTHI